MNRILAACALGLAVVIGAALHGQAPAPPATSFDVASIKPSNPNPPTLQAGVPMILPALGRLQAQNVTLRMLIMGAYQKQPFQIVGGLDWINQTKFDITARAADATASTDGLLEMLRGLLADRFKLKVHTETREVPIYALMVARSDGRLGPKMKPSTAECPGYKEQQQKMLEAIAKGGAAGLAAVMPKPGESVACGISPIQPPPAPGAIGMRMNGMTVDLLTLLLTQLMGRPVVDKTGLTGLYDYDVIIDMQTLMRVYSELGINVPLPPNLPEGPSLTTVLQEELGLKLDSQRGPGEVLVIDSAELPMPD